MKKKNVSPDHALALGKWALCQEKPRQALRYFEQAFELSSSENLSDFWYEAACALLDFGEEEALLSASRFLKSATLQKKEDAKIWFAWGSVLLDLGLLVEERHFLLEATLKFQKAVDLLPQLNPLSTAHLYWEMGRVWTELSHYSGEAIDIRSAIEAFKIAATQESLPSLFWSDFGEAYLQMGLLINDSRFYLQAAEYLIRATQKNEHCIPAWAALADTYAQSYLNSMDERIAHKASDAYEQLCLKNPLQAQNWLGWAQLLGESGRITRNTKKLELSIEKASHGFSLDSECRELLCQWVESLSYLGVYLDRLDLLIEAEQKITKAADTFPDDPDIWYSYGICLISFGQYYQDTDYCDQAIEKIQEGISLDRTHAELWHALALAHTYIAHWVEDPDMAARAKRFFARAIDLKPAYPPLLFDAANAYLLSSDLREDTQDLEESLQLFETLLQGTQSVLVHHPEWLVQYATALEWFADSSSDERYLFHAIDLYLHALLIDPEMPRLYFRIALCWIRLGDYALEAEYYRRGLHYFRLASQGAEEDDAVWLEWGLGLIHLAQTESYEENAQNHYVEAEEKLIRAGALGNEHAPYALACLYSLLHRYEEGMALIEQAARAGALPSIEELLEDDWLENMRKTEAFIRFLAKLEAKEARGEMYG